MKVYKEGDILYYQDVNDLIRIASNQTPVYVTAMNSLYNVPISTGMDVAPCSLMEAYDVTNEGHYLTRPITDARLIHSHLVAGWEGGVSMATFGLQPVWVKVAPDALEDGTLKNPTWPHGPKPGTDCLYAGYGNWRVFGCVRDFQGTLAVRAVKNDLLPHAVAYHEDIELPTNYYELSTDIGELFVEVPYAPMPRLEGRYQWLARLIAVPEIDNTSGYNYPSFELRTAVNKVGNSVLPSEGAALIPIPTGKRVLGQGSTTPPYFFINEFTGKHADMKFNINCIVDCSPTSGTENKIHWCILSNQVDAKYRPPFKGTSLLRYVGGIASDRRPLD